ncbi:MAG: hypothetical protein A3F77_07885 [Betaproteobacteria bacterium RIFCSPLOWO2_12_FULL_67_28]|nr:MAG: hypothetical protein A3F77_07885 [Betaproteobacteria bacterium RIFCSPLOWO2_12_FULL_67_28]
MKNCTIRAGLIALAFLLGAAPSLAQDKPGVPGAPDAKSAAKEVKKAGRPSKPIDINSAGKAQLKKLPGIGDAEADGIIAGRPYRSKADLATRKILPTGIYLQIKRQIIAKQKPEAAAKAAGK